MKRKIPSIEDIDRKIKVCTETGVATWIHSGKTAGARYRTKQGKRYLQIKLFGVVYPLHRVVAKYAGILTNEDLQVDHKDGNGLNNSPSNLRQVTPSQNNKNRKLPKNNTSGVIGVNYCSKTGKWQARIGANGRRVSLGYFDNLEDALRVRKMAESDFEYSSDHGSDRPI